MRENDNKTDIENGASAASLMKINVRKTQEDRVQDISRPKTGDITERLAALARELDETENPGTHERELPLPEQPQTRRSAWDSSQPDRRVTSRKSTGSSGWGTKNAPPDILNYWMEIRGGQRRYPSWEALDTNVIGKNWPNCLLVHCNREVGRLQVKYGFTHSLRKAVQENTTDEEILNRIEFSPMIVDWILGVGREVAATRKPAHGTEHFPSVTGEFPLRVIALPLSEDGGDIDHVLCYVQKLQ